MMYSCMNTSRLHQMKSLTKVISSYEVLGLHITAPFLSMFTWKLVFSQPSHWTWWQAHATFNVVLLGWWWDHCLLSAVMIRVMFLPLHKSVIPVFILEVDQCLLAGHTKIHYNGISMAPKEDAKMYKYLWHSHAILCPWHIVLAGPSCSGSSGWSSLSWGSMDSSDSSFSSSSSSSFSFS